MRLASTCRRRCSPAPTRSSNEATGVHHAAWCCDYCQTTSRRRAGGGGQTGSGRIVCIGQSSYGTATDAFLDELRRAGFVDTRRDRIVNFAADQRLPAIYQFREYASAGGLLSYGVSLTDGYRQFGTYAASILNGANPATLPVQQSIKFELVLNLKTARALKLELPPTLLALADEVIE
jgi:hypothetical protein